eukprot:TRINITY_DN12976_c0_g3_i1.p1 TRINITY_DN12976_c0_g3~~TRINITY_DN12976_c0_g3_i1.p1  ORF type:complete len:240 (+),score=37.56 TRINITY_DN12976_c0_g3_i1:46-720(+)
MIQSKLDIHIAAAHQKVADHVEEVVQGLEGVLLDQSELAKTAQAVSDEVQQILREKVEACAQESFEYATQRFNRVLHSFGETNSMHVAKPLFVRAPITSDVLQAARDVVVDRMEHARHKVVQEDVTSTRANEAVADTLLRAKAARATMPFVVKPQRAQKFSQTSHPHSERAAVAASAIQRCARDLVFISQLGFAPKVMRVAFVTCPMMEKSPISTRRVEIKSRA